MRHTPPPLPALQCIGVASFLGGPGAGPELGPEVLRAAGLLATLRHAGLPAAWRATLKPPAGERTAALHRLLARLADEAEAVIRDGGRPLFIGGDHAQAAGAWRGVGRGLGKAPGLIWIDAHLDAHIPATSPSGNPHGMPLAALLGHGESWLAGIPGPDLDPRHVAVIGARSFEPEEARLLAGLGVRVFAAPEIAERGLAAVFADALAIARGAGAFGVSLDLDAIDPREFAAVSTPADGGLRFPAVRDMLHGLLRQPDCTGMEIVEYSPQHDPQGRTARRVLDLLESAAAPGAPELRQFEDRHGARNYEALPPVLAEGQGSWVTDVEGRRHLDLVAGCSGAGFGHAHPRLVAALARQAGRLAVTTRAFHNDRLPLLLRRLSELTGYARALPMSTGLEAVETALKAARKWAVRVKGVPANRAEIVACYGSCHGASLAALGLSTTLQARDGFGPFLPGMKCVPYGDAEALESAITRHTAAFIVEPIQGEGGVVVPPEGYLRACAELCRRHQVLFIADEIQTGLGRTGRLLAVEHEGVRPDAVLLGKALGGGLLPVSALLADDALMQIFTPGDHVSTFGGNPLAAAVALEALDVLEDEGLVERAAETGAWLHERLADIAARSPLVESVRGRGLFAGIELNRQTDAYRMTLSLAERGVLVAETRGGSVIRLAPPLNAGREDLEWGLARIAEALKARGVPLPKAA